MKQFILHSWILFLMVVLTGCSQDDADAVDSAQTPIEFTADSPARFITRGVIENNSQLQSAGFGVLAYYTGADNWATAGTGTTPNFMYNQQVSYEGGWTYSPVKYWPNDNNPADGSGAEGSQTNSYVSFFAYAPYNGTGITLSNNTTTGAPTINYTWGAENDLLYASQLDCYKTMTSPGSYGTVGGQVPFNFQHALAQVKFKVRRSSDFGMAVTLKNLSVSGFKTGGVFNLGSSSWTSTTDFNPESDAPLSLRSSDLSVTAITESAAHDLGGSLLIPGSSLTYSISYTIGGANYSHDVSLVPTPISSLQAGYQYTIIFTIDNDGVIVNMTKYTEQW